MIAERRGGRLLVLRAPLLAWSLAVVPILAGTACADILSLPDPHLRSDAGGTTHDAGGDGAEPGDGGDASDDGGSGDAPPSGDPTSCADVRARSPGSGDGVYVVDPDGTGPIKAFHVWCARMADLAATPLAYLDLGGRQNDATWASGGYCTCPGWTRSFTKVRIDLAGMAVLTHDLTYATANRAPTCEVDASFCMGPGKTDFANPGSCVTNNDSSGVAHVDLSATEVHIAPDQTFVGGGFMFAGGATVSSDGKVATIHGGGACGWYEAAPAGGQQLRVARD